ncbi:MAG: FemAB family protein [Methanocella sp. PtaU1.Bin125]|nr:MAG: FemAB family protein [Methanocella sp. PtaU1.Bin125]
MAISIIDDPALWDRTVDESPWGLLFHRWDFLKIAERHTGCRLLPYGIYKGNQLLSLFPVFYRKDFVLRSVFSPPPQACIPYLGPTMSALTAASKPGTQESHLQTVADEITAEIGKLRPGYVYFQLPPLYNDIRPFKWNGYDEVSHFTYFIDISRPPEEILKGFDKNLRWTLKKAGELPLELRRVSDAERFCDIVGKRYAEQGLTFPIASPRYLQDLLETFPDHVKMFFLYHGGEIASVITVCQYKGRMIYWMGNAKTGSGIAGNDFMLWSIIRMAKEEGCREFEIQGAGDRRLWHFKSKYNPRLATCYAVSKKGRLGRAAEWAYFNVRRRTRARGAPATTGGNT